MKNIKEIRSLLVKAIVRLSVVDCISECWIRQALELFPCETCFDTGVDGFKDNGSTPFPCPDCNSKQPLTM